MEETDSTTPNPQEPKKRGFDLKYMIIIIFLWLIYYVSASNHPYSSSSSSSTYTPPPKPEKITAIPETDPDLLHFAGWAEDHKLKWNVHIGASGNDYCVQAHDPKTFEYFVDCSDMKEATADVIRQWNVRNVKVGNQ